MKKMSVWNIAFSYKGRIDRQTWWIATSFAGFSFFVGVAVLWSDPGGILGLFGLLMPLSLYVHIPITVKRLHDRNKSGWGMLIEFVPIIGVFVSTIECGFLKGTEGTNHFGMDPFLYDLDPRTVKYIRIIQSIGNQWRSTVRLHGSHEYHTICRGVDESEARRQAAMLMEYFGCEVVE